MLLSVYSRDEISFEEVCTNEAKGLLSEEMVEVNSLSKSDVKEKASSESSCSKGRCCDIRSWSIIELCRYG